MRPESIFMIVGMILAPVDAEPIQPGPSGRCHTNRVALRADTGGFISRCTNCAPGAYPDSASIEKITVDAASQWIVHRTKKGKIAFQHAESTRFLARCNNCYFNSNEPDAAFVHETNLETSSWAQWTPEGLANGKIAFRADNGRYLARCSNCVTGGSHAVFAFVHGTSPDDPSAQFDIVCS